jgi:tetratricopeptide (TPR) repeat protein
LSSHEADYGALQGRAIQFVQTDHLNQAAQGFEQILQRRPDFVYLRFQTAIVCLRMGDQDTYRRHCRVLLQNARGTSDPRIADQAAKACLLSRENVQDLQPAAALADRAARLGTGDSVYHYFQLVKGMAAYRMGKDAEALDLLRKCQKARSADCSSTALVFEAMSLYRLGKPDEALAALGGADAQYRQLEIREASSPHGPLGLNWVDMLIFQIARQEAVKIVMPPTPDEK